VANEIERTTGDNEPTSLSVVSLVSELELVVCNERSFSSRVRRRSSACAWYSRSAARFSRTLRSRTLEYSPSICRSRSGLSLNDSATSINWSASNCGICDGSSLLVNLRKFIKPSKSIFNNSAAHATNTHRSIQSVSQSVSQHFDQPLIPIDRSIDPVAAM
jgi:hypothetical protein